MQRAAGKILGFVIGKLAPKWFVWIFAKPFIAGKNLFGAIKRSGELNGDGFAVTLDYVGENSADTAEVQHVKIMHLLLADAVTVGEFDAHIAIKLSHFGLFSWSDAGIEIDQELASHGCAALEALLAETKANATMVWVDAEALDTRAETWRICRELSAKYENIGICIQAYAPDAVEFLANQTATGWQGPVRVCKGAYRELGRHTLKGEELYQGFISLCLLTVSSGLYLQVATHDELLIERVEKMIEPFNHEHGMLLGVNRGLTEKLRGRGERVNIYGPFGEDFRGYVARRLAENPKYILLPLQRIFGA